MRRLICTLSARGCQLNALATRLQLRIALRHFVQKAKVQTLTSGVHKWPRRCFKPNLLTYRQSRTIFSSGVPSIGLQEEPEDGERGSELPLDPIIKVFAITTAPNYFLPWQMKPSREMTGSGFVIDARERRIVTNAHVVADHTYVTVRRFGNPTKYQADVEAVGHDCDLALLAVKDTEFWEDMYPLQFGEIPRLHDSVAVLGYPTGGDNISVTRGVVSRIEPQRYAHGSTHLLSIQIDAAINPGNSGGPAVDVNNNVVGVAFQSLVGAENIGFIIPIPIIKHFLEDIRRHGTYTGFGQLGIQCQPLENSQMRQFFKLKRDMTGVLINEIAQLSAAQKVLKKDDILLAIDGIPIANDGTVPFRGGSHIRERILFDYILSEKFIGEPVRLTVWRDGAQFDVEVPLSQMHPLAPIHTFDKVPNYFIHGGLVFQPLSVPYLLEYGTDWYNTAPRKLCLLATTEYRKEEDEEVVILSSVLVDKINYGYNTISGLQLLRFNGKKVKNLKHLYHEIQSTTEPYLRFEFDEHLTILLNTQEAKDSNARILANYKIPPEKAFHFD